MRVKMIEYPEFVVRPATIAVTRDNYIRHVNASNFAKTKDPLIPVSASCQISHDQGEMCASIEPKFHLCGIAFSWVSEPILPPCLMFRMTYQLHSGNNYSMQHMANNRTNECSSLGRFRHIMGDQTHIAAGFKHLDWSVAIPQARPDALKREGLSRAGFGADDMQFTQSFETVHRTWMASQFLNGEAAAANVCDRLAETLPDAEARCCAAVQARDEHRHHAVLRRFQRERVEAEGFAPADGLAELVRQIDSDSRWDMQMLGLQIVVESLALATYRLTAAGAADPVLRGIATEIAQEEERHVGFGLAMLGEASRNWTAAERHERESFALEAASLLSIRYLMGELWERLGIDRARGEAFTRTDPMMIAYRRTVFSRVRKSIADLGLLSQRVVEGLEKIDLGPNLQRPRRD
jgi:rubrerythrin